MKMTVSQIGNLGAEIERDIARLERQTTRVMNWAGAEIKDAWRADIREAGLGDRLANAVRFDTYPRSEDSMNAATLVWTNAPKITATHDEGALIQAKDGLWLAFPLPAAGVSLKGGRISPEEWERRFGMKLRFVYRKGRSALLVVDDARVSKRKRLAKRKGGRRRKDGILTGAQTVPVFVLVRQVRLPKRTDLMPEAQRIADQVPALLGWPD